MILIAAAAAAGPDEDSADDDVNGSSAFANGLPKVSANVFITLLDC